MKNKKGFMVANLIIMNGLPIYNKGNIKIKSVEDFEKFWKEQEKISARRKPLVKL